MLFIVVMAAMSGANSVKAIARFAQKLDMPQRRELCMPHAKSRADVVSKHEYKVPSYVTIYNFLKTLMGIVSAVNAENGVPVAVAVCSRKEGETRRCEIPVGRRLLSETDLTNALVCSDALHCQHDTVRTVAASNGESLGDCFQLLLRVAYGFRNIDTMIGLIMLFCSPIEIPRPGRKQNEPINKGLSRLRRPEVTHTYARRAQKVLTHHKS